MRILRLLPRFRQAYRELAHLAERETWSRSTIEAFQLERLNRLWRHAREHVPYYRQLAATRDLPPTFQNLEEYSQSIPTVSKAEVRSTPQLFLSERSGKGCWHSTGGSTGEPTSCYWGRDAYREMLRTRYRYYQMWGVDPLDRCAFLWGHAASLAPGWKGKVAKLQVPVQDWLRSRLRLSAYDMTEETLARYLQRLEKFGPRSMYGYSRSLYLLALAAERCEVQLPALELITLTGEPSSPTFVEKIESVFGVPATVEYGSTECGVIASEWPDRTLRVREDIIYVETLRRDDDTHEIVATPLGNWSFPLLRFRVADLTDAPLHRPASGFALLHPVSGRDNDYIATRSGRLLHSARFDALFKYAQPPIRRFRVHQRADGTVEVALELAKAETCDMTCLQREIETLVDGYPVTVSVVKSIPQTAAGKHRLVTSDLAVRANRQSAAELARAGVAASKTRS